MNGRPRILRAAAASGAVLLLLAMGGCSHYHIGIPLVPGLSLGLGATKDGAFSVGLNTGFGPLGAGVAVNNSGVVSGSTSVGVGVGPVGAGIGKSVVLHDPNAPAQGANPAVASAAPATVATAAPTAPVVPSGPAASVVPNASVPRNATAPVVVRKPSGTKTAAATPAPPTAARVTYRTPEVAAAASAARDNQALGTPGNPVAP